MGGVYDYVGESSKSIPLLRTALRLNPDGGYLYYQILGRAYLFDNDIEQALINLGEAVARNSVDLETRVHRAAALVASGDRAAAEWEAVEIRSLQSDFLTRSWLKTYPLTSQKHTERLLHLLEQVGL